MTNWIRAAMIVLAVPVGGVIVGLASANGLVAGVLLVAGALAAVWGVKWMLDEMDRADRYWGEKKPGNGGKG